MPIVQRTIEIAAPPERVWAVVSDVERWHEWTASIERVELLEKGSFAMGSRARVRQPKLPAAVWTVTHFEPGRVFVWVNRRGGVEAIGEHHVAPSTTGTTATLSLEMRGLLSGLVFRLYRKLMAEYVDLEAKGLKARSESPAFRHGAATK